MKNEKISVDKVEETQNDVSSLAKFQAAKDAEKGEQLAKQTEEDAKIETPVETHVAEGENSVTWQFRYRNYREIIDITDPDVPRTISGRQSKICIKARNWRIDLDLTIPREKKIHEKLLASNQKGSSFWLLKDVDRDKDLPVDRAETLRKLMDMEIAQLMSFLSNDEMEEAGLLPGTPDKMQLIMAIIDMKKLEDR